MQFLTKPLIHVKFGIAHEFFDWLALTALMFFYRAHERPPLYDKSLKELFAVNLPNLMHNLE